MKADATFDAQFSCIAKKESFDSNMVLLGRVGGIFELLKPV